MPLNPAKAKHITTKIDKLFAQRAQTVTLNFPSPTPPQYIQGIFRIGETGSEIQHIEIADAILLLQARDISLATLRTVSYVTPSATTQLTIGSLYIIIGIVPRGVLANPDRFYCYMERGIIVTLGLRNADNTITYIQPPAIVAPLADADPTLGKEGNDLILYLRYTDVTHKQLRSTIHIDIPANTAPGASTANDIAYRYLITSIHAERIPENVDRWVLTLDRQR